MSPALLVALGLLSAASAARIHKGIAEAQLAHEDSSKVEEGAAEAGNQTQLAHEETGKVADFSINCDSKTLERASELAGVGNNAYVLRMTKSACGIKKGDILKAFLKEDWRDENIQTLHELGSKIARRCNGVSASLAGFPSDCLREPGACAIDAKCVHAPKKMMDGFKSPFRGSNCYFVRSVSGGARTLQDCLAKGPRRWKTLLSAAVRRLQCLHSQDYVHTDAQPKNIMVDSACNADTMMLVDLDGVKPMDSVHWALNDYQMLFQFWCSDKKGYGSDYGHKNLKEWKSVFEGKVRDEICPIFDGSPSSEDVAERIPDNILRILS